MCYINVIVNPNKNSAKCNVSVNVFLLHSLLITVQKIVQLKQPLCLLKCQVGFQFLELMIQQESLEIKECLSAVVHQKHHAGLQLIIVEEKCQLFIAYQCKPSILFPCEYNYTKVSKTWLFPCFYLQFFSQLQLSCGHTMYMYFSHLTNFVLIDVVFLVCAYHVWLATSVT